MRKQNLRKVRWDRERNRAYVLRDEVRYWAPEGSVVPAGAEAQVFNPNLRTVTVRLVGRFTEIWRADATSPGSGG